MHYCSVNGQLSNQLVVGERGLSFGDGIFTTAKIYQGKVEHWTRHKERLVNGCQRLSIVLPDF